MGQRGSQIGSLTFENVELAGDALLAEEGRGFYMMMNVLEKGRVGIAALAVGIAQAGLEAALESPRCAGNSVARSPKIKESSGYWPTCQGDNRRPRAGAPRRHHDRQR